MKKFLTVFMVLLFLSTLLNAAEKTNNELKKHSFGIGFGVPYGGLGLNADFAMGSNFYISTGVGGGFGFTGGIRYIFTSLEKTFRPRISLFYGNNSLAKVEYSYKDSEYEEYKGVTILLGAQWMFGHKKRHGFDFDVSHNLSDDYNSNDFIGKPGVIKVTEPGKTSLSFGYRYSF